MSDSGRSDPSIRGQRPQPLRGVIYAAVAVQAALWIVAVVYIGLHANPKGDGMEWAAVVPATVILALGVAPPLALRRQPRLLWVGALMAAAGMLLMAGLLFEIVRELH